MGSYRHLTDTIKTHFAKTPSAQLQEIVRTKDPNRWSAEAITAAGEVLQDRASGRAGEPLAVEEDVMQLACLWSIDPTTLDKEFKEPVMGLLGHANWGVSRASRRS